MDEEVAWQRRRPYGAQSHASSATAGASSFIQRDLQGQGHYRGESLEVHEAQALLLPQDHHRAPDGAVQRLLKSVKGTVLWAVVKGIRKRYKQMADLTKKLCCMAFTPDVVYLRLLDIEVTDELVEAFRHELERYLRSGGITVRWRVGSPVPANTVTIVLHQTEQRLDAKALVRKLDQLAGADDGWLTPPILAFLMLHNPAMAAAPPDSRSMTDDYSYEKLERLSLSGSCLDCYFWSAGMADRQLRELNQPAFREVYQHVRDVAGSPRRDRTYVSDAPARAAAAQPALAGSQQERVLL